ncbi:MAG: element excision factor XisI family protein [bacterium]|nr:element excision factor XisI family protein [bacterium]
MNHLTIDLAAVVQREVEVYAGPAIQAETYPIVDHQRRTYAVVVVPDLPRPFKARVVVMARIVGDSVVIDEDTTDRPLWQALEAAGIPREKIVRL